jgi:hypothetical protein
VRLESRGSSQTLMTMHTAAAGLVDQHARGWLAIAEQFAGGLVAMDSGSAWGWRDSGWEWGGGSEGW